MQEQGIAATSPATVTLPSTEELHRVHRLAVRCVNGFEPLSFWAQRASARSGRAGLVASTVILAA
jgi:hypothetical protein